jgi:Ca2+/Na+ antiporter
LDVCAKAYGFNDLIKIYVICVIFSFIIDLYNFEFSYFNIVKILYLLYFTLFLNDSLKKKRECVKERNNLKNNKK